MNVVSRLWRGLQGLAAAWSDDRCARRAAALSYYTAFSIAPILVIVLAVAGLIVETTTLSGAIIDQARMLMGDAGAELLENLLEASRNGARQGWAAAAAFAVLLVGATSAFAELKDSLDELFGYEGPAPEGLWGMLRARLLSFGLVLVLAFLLLVSLAVNAALAVVSSYLFGDGLGWALRAISWVATLVVVMGTFAAIYKLLPAAHLAWRDALLGASVTAGLFLVGRYLIGLYLGNSAPASAFGAAGSLAVLLLWVYYSASVFFLGAEVTRLFIARTARRATGAGDADWKLPATSSAAGPAGPSLQRLRSASDTRRGRP
jgi:membrane protein